MAPPSQTPCGAPGRVGVFRSVSFLAGCAGNSLLYLRGTRQPGPTLRRHCALQRFRASGARDAPREPITSEAPNALTLPARQTRAALQCEVVEQRRGSQACSAEVKKGIAGEARKE